MLMLSCQQAGVRPPTDWSDLNWKGQRSKVGWSDNKERQWVNTLSRTYVTVVGNESSCVFLRVCVWVWVSVPWEQCGTGWSPIRDWVCASCASPSNHMILMLGEASWHGAQTRTNVRTHTHAGSVTHTHSYLISVILPCYTWLSLSYPQLFLTPDAKCS